VAVASAGRAPTGPPLAARPTTQVRKERPFRALPALDAKTSLSNLRLTGEAWRAARRGCGHPVPAAPRLSSPERGPLSATGRPGREHASSQANTSSRRYRRSRPSSTTGIAPDCVDSRSHDTGTESSSATSSAVSSLSFTPAPVCGRPLQRRTAHGRPEPRDR
jgi:hypothetical protein